MLYTNRHTGEKYDCWQYTLENAASMKVPAFIKSLLEQGRIVREQVGLKIKVGYEFEIVNLSDWIVVSVRDTLLRFTDFEFQKAFYVHNNYEKRGLELTNEIQMLEMEYRLYLACICGSHNGPSNVRLATNLLDKIRVLRKERLEITIKHRGLD